LTRRWTGGAGATSPTLPTRVILTRIGCSVRTFEADSARAGGDIEGDEVWVGRVASVFNASAGASSNWSGDRDRARSWNRDRHGAR